MNSEEYLVSFLLNYDIIHIYGTYEKLLDAIYVSTIPTDLLIIKFFEYAFFKSKSVDEIYELFTGQTTEYPTIEADKKIISKLLELVGQRETQFIELNEKLIKAVIKSFPNLMPKPTQQNSKSVIHEGVPLPDPIKGRPRLGWCVCKFKNCGQKFSSGMALVDHLTKCNVYTQGFHHHHENAVYNLYLTPEKVKSLNMTKCPSIACNYKDFETSEKLIRHLTLLGIEPFWQKGIILNTDDEKIDRTMLLNFVPKLYITDTCIICLDNKPNIITNNCRHHVYCTTCFNPNIPNLCPICRTKVDSFFPYA